MTFPGQRAQPIYCKFCERRINRGRDNFDERWENGKHEAWHFVCAPVKGRWTWVSIEKPI